MFERLMEELIAKAAQRVRVDFSLVSVDSRVVRAHHDAAGMRVREEVLTALQEAAIAEKGVTARDENRRTAATPRPMPPNAPSGDASGGGAGPRLESRPAGPFGRRADHQGPPRCRATLLSAFRGAVVDDHSSVVRDIRDRVRAQVTAE
ncbi:hypothetical protein ACWEKM_13460 [Streptomyces sp. NPDC004752]